MALCLLQAPLSTRYPRVPFLFTLCSQALSDVISVHGCNFHKYANKTKLSKNAPSDEFCSVQTGIQTCIDDFLSRMNNNKLMLNTDKTEVMAVGTSSRLSRVDCNSVNIGGSNIPYKTSVKYFGVKTDQTLSMQDHISNVCRTSFIELRHLAPIRPYLSERTFARLVAALITSRLDHRNSVSTGLLRNK